MVAQIPTETTTPVIYPDCDGNPMSDNTKQFRWIVTIKENLELLSAEDPQVFIAGDLLWYPVEGDNKIRQAPDVMVVFGRPKGDRGSYRQWVEDNIPPQVVFEILSPGNRMAEMSRKLHFYDRYGVSEYYIYDPDRIDLAGWVRHEDRLESISQGEGSANEDTHNWISPRLGIRFSMQEDTLVIYRPDDRPFLSFVEIDQLRQQAQQETQQARQETQQARQETQQARQEILQVEQQAEKLAAKLRELGIDPNDL
ncbi:Uma2 family endonuclease [Chamaesiphon sp.]|uniref:Uma2 family endonuclease n=1 Tax=Chamaesiphon sp. TaxID=2814140 RepID=UPI0035937918